ncbi:SEC12-like protein 2 [Hordeum vulgare]|nr:SEC12-like protein 2 [Hordeum vulgare]
METTSSSLSGSGFHSSRSPSSLLVKLEPQETPLGWCTRSGAHVINEGSVPSPPAASCQLIKPNTESALLPVKEHESMAIEEETGLKWAWYDYIRHEMERQRHALKEIAA